MHKLPCVSHGKSCFWGVDGKNGGWGGGQELLGELQLRKHFSKYLGKEGCLQVPFVLLKPPALSLSQTHSSAYPFRRKNGQKPAKPHAWPPASALAQPSPAQENGWLGSVQGPEGLVKEPHLYRALGPVRCQLHFVPSPQTGLIHFIAC